MIEDVDDFKRKLLIQISGRDGRVNTVHRRERTTQYESYTVDIAKQIRDEFTNAINLIEENK